MWLLNIKALHTLCLILFLAHHANAAKILAVFVFPGPSQYIFGSALLKELAKRGHEVTSISSFPQHQPLKNFRDITVQENLKLVKGLMADIEHMHEQTVWQMLNSLSQLGAKISENVFKNSQVQALLRSQTEKFDLIVAEAFYTDSLYGLAQHFNAPIIGVFSLGPISWVDSLVGNTSPVSYVPHFALPFGSRMNFAQRFTNLALNIFEQLHFNYYHLPAQRALYKAYFPAAKIELDQLLKNFSLVLLNTHFTIGQARPFVPNMIEVGGMHVNQQPLALPGDLQQFLDDAKEGAIYFSMGSNLQGKDLPIAKRQIFLNSLGALKQKVLWKFEDSADKLNMPPNVLISKWFPQPSVLAHRNVKLFITHGGLLSTTEAIFHGKPMLGIPMFGDQPLNVANAVRQGYALAVEFKNLNEKELKQKLLELLTNQSYTQVVQQLSQRYRDQPMPPLETAVYWTEYVLRHEGATHLRVAAQDLSFIQYHSFDTIALLLGIIVTVMMFLLWSSLKLLQMLFGALRERKHKLKRN